MSVRHALQRVAIQLTFATLAACGKLPDLSDADMDSREEPTCYEGRDSTVNVTICEVNDPKLLEDFRAERWLPRPVRALRGKSALQYGEESARVASVERASARAKRHHSSMVPHMDSRYSLSGWDLYDGEERIALLLLVLDHRWALAYSETNAPNVARVRHSLQRLMDEPYPIALRARLLYPP